MSDSITIPDPDETPTDHLGDPDDFALDEWLEGADPTHRSVDVYAAGRMVAQRDDLERQIKAHEAPAVRALGGNPADDLRRQWRELTDKILASKLTVEIRALSKERIREVTEEYRKAHKIKDEWMPVGPRAMFDPIKMKKWDHEGQQQAAVLDAVVALVTRDGRRIEPAFRDAEQAQVFIDKIGPAQWSMVEQAFEDAVSKSPVIGVDFSPASSSDDDGEES
ncbi:hypothetical protein ACI3EY_16595 [Ornithinimicrobium sp. LYQ92]|uniref:hypothetical protein n=1 Tax=Serinicoccus sp. LYQ92 TaxID=3378798 RepID=UPI0038520BED